MSYTNGGAAVTEQPLHHQWTMAGPVITHLPDTRLHEVREVSEAAIGEPGPMSLFGFAVATLLVAIPISSELPMPTVYASLPALLVFGGIGQFIGGLFAYRKGNTFAATAFCSFGANNVVVATYFLFQQAGVFPKTGNTMLFLAIDLFCFAYIAFILFVASFRLNAAFTLVLLALFPGYGLAACGNIASLPVVIGQIGGWFLICSAGLAFYAGGALALNSTYERTVLPMFPRARA
ncbi:MAG TPA: acetate uptake transporter [Jatrophihabitans sp.]|nr:acetate uptake transporter [Jatrophihabitans sp.]